jgi:hypothetical protein
MCLFLCAVLLMTAVPAPSARAAPDNWTTTGSLVTARSYHTATLLPDGRVLVVEGKGIRSRSSISSIPPYETTSISLR